MICSIINEGTAPRHAPGGLQPTSKPVAPSKHRQYTLDRIGRAKFKARRSAQLGTHGQVAAPLAIAHDPCLVALPVAVFVHRPLVVLFLSLGETNGQLGAAVFPVQLQGDQGVTLALYRSYEARQLTRVEQE